MDSDRIEVDIKVPNQTRYLCLIGHIGENIALALRHYGGDREKLAYELNLVLTEAMANAIVHANEGDPAKEVHIEIGIAEKRLTIRVYDTGQGFDIRQFAEHRHTHSTNMDAESTSFTASWTRSSTVHPHAATSWR